MAASRFVLSGGVDGNRDGNVGRQPASSAAVKRSAGATRALFQQVVDDILDQIRDGRLNPNDPLPSARKMADVYGVASMTAQRALRELQNRRITYAVAGKGTFVHPDAFDLLRSAALQEPIDDPELRRRVATYLADQQAITIRYHQARTAADKNTALQDLLDHADTHSQLIDEVIKYQADHGNFAKPPAIAAAASDNDPPTAPTKCRSSHTREPKQ